MKNIIFLSFVLISLSLAACTGAGAGGPGPRTWIDSPLDGMTLELGPIVVISHAASDGGTAQAALMVNGEEVRMDEAADSASPLIEFAQAWTPDTEGEYVLQVISTDHAGNEGRSNRVTVCVGVATANCELTAADTSEAITTETAAVTPTATEVGLPTITFTQSTNCRLGDSTTYDAIDAYEEGETLVIEGRNSATTWFWVLRPNSTAHCWVSGSTGTLEGPYQTVPVIAPPPTETPEAGQGVPTTPGNLHVSGEVCNAQEYKVTIQWNDVSGEDGYRVYRDGALIATLGANVTTYTDTPPNYNAHNYGVEAFNASGTSGRPIVNEDGCLF